VVEVATAFLSCFVVLLLVVVVFVVCLAAARAETNTKHRTMSVSNKVSSGVVVVGNLWWFGPFVRILLWLLWL